MMTQEANKQHYAASPFSAPSPYPMARIMLVDDAPEIMVLLMHILKRGGLEAHMSDSRDAVELYKNFSTGGTPFSLLILDWSMPAVTGIDVARQIREIDQDVKIVFLSAYYELIKPEEMEEVNAEVWAKPIDVKLFYDNVCRVLG